jgi:hypothetical protein
MKSNIECRQLKPRRTLWNREFLSQITTGCQFEIKPHKLHETLLFGFNANCLTSDEYTTIISNEYVAMHWLHDNTLHVIVNIKTSSEISKKWKSSFKTVYVQVWRDTGLDKYDYIKEYESTSVQVIVQSLVRYRNVNEVKVDVISKSSTVTLKLEIAERTCGSNQSTELMEGQESHDWFGLGTSKWAFKKQLKPNLYGKQLAVRSRDVYFTCKIVKNGKAAGQLSFGADDKTLYFSKLKMFMANLILLNRDRISRDEYVEFAMRMTKHYLIGGHMIKRNVFEDTVDILIGDKGLEPFGSCIKEIWINPMHHGDNRKAMAKAKAEFNLIAVEAACANIIEPTPKQIADITGLCRQVCAKHMQTIGLTTQITRAKNKL